MADAAAAQEAKWLQVKPPTPFSVREDAELPTLFLGAYLEGQLGGAIGVAVVAIAKDSAEALGSAPSPLDISLLVVHPEVQRRGLARALLQAALARNTAAEFVVTVAARHAAALALYTQFGFVPFRQGQLGAERLAVLQLRRHAGRRP